MPPTSLLLAGTKKGLFILTSEGRQKWNLHGPFHRGKEINHAVYDPRSHRVYATANDSWFGSGIAWSNDLGKTWVTPQNGPKFDPSSGLKLDRIWHIEPGRAEEPDVLYAGVAPAALFRSADGGQNWTEVTGLTSHPSRERWQPGYGGLCLHSIILDPKRPQRMFVGISAAGVFRTDNDGKDWAPLNKGTRAEFLPEKYPEFGQCVHKLLMASGDSSLLFQQNHCGMYRSENAGESWTEITSGLPSDFGFPLALHPREPKTAYVIPLQGAEFRCPPEGKLTVFRTRDGGKTWEGLNSGLPTEHAYAGIYREGMSADTADPAAIYFGTNTGTIYYSIDEGDSWQILAENLPPVFSVSAAHIS
jgi:photosystem II stability/assembly factor-like uncharacterized protein